MAICKKNFCEIKILLLNFHFFSASTNGTLSQEEQDRMLAMALAQSEREARSGGGTTTTNSSNDKTCQIS